MQSEVEKTAGISGVLVAAHELKAPLGVIRQLALTLQLAESKAMRTRLESQLIRTTEQALKQVEDLAKIPQLQKEQPVFELVSVRAICNEVIHEVRPLFCQEQRRLQVAYHNRTKVAVTNQNLLRSVIYNFCTNAMRYSDQESESQLTVQDYHDKIRVSVRDFGPALPQSIWRKLQGGHINQPLPVAMRPGSTGLGLYIVSQFTQVMRANFGAIKHVDGTSFYVDLPALEQPGLAL